MAVGYVRQLYLLPRELEDQVSDQLWCQGTLGLQSLEEGDGRLRIEAYFPAEAAMEIVGLPPEVECLGVEDLPDADWLEPYRRHVQPLTIGRRLLVDPREPDAGPLPPAEGRVVLRLPAREAFGTGSHESTRLVLELLEDLDLPGRAVLDVGTGSGILCFAALVFGARLAVGFDVDPVAVLLAGQNRALNGLEPQLFTGSLAALRPGASFDLALVNILPEYILPELDLLPPLLASGGRAIFSGILETIGAEVLAQLQARGFVLERQLRSAEWVAFQLRLEAG